MFIIFTKPQKTANSFKEACQIADRHYQLTNEIVAVEDTEANRISFPNDD